MEQVLQNKDRFIEKGREIVKKLRVFFNSYPCYIMETWLAVLFVLSYQEVIGALVFLALLSVILMVCDDITTTTLPFLLIATFTTNCRDSMSTFMQYIPFAPLVGLAMIYHFVIYHKKFRFGDSIYPIACVSIAILLGGIGNFDLLTYVKGAYYYIGLGVGMMIAHVLMKSQFVIRRGENFRERFAWIMTLVGFLCVAMIGIGYMRKILHLRYNAYYSIGYSRNNLCTMLMFAMPFPLFLAKKKEWYAIFTVILYGAICISTSRGGLLFGTVEFGVCCLLWMMQKGVKSREFKVRLSICFIAVGTIMLALGQVVADVLVNRLFAEGILENSDRMVMFKQGMVRFARSPLIGAGLLDNTIAYGEYRKAGTMAWYHMMIPQVMGGMGLLGVAAYGLQIWHRFRQALTKPCLWSLVLGISYLGVLLMSQVNPGVFCPVPFETLAVLLAIFQERRLEEEAMPLSLEKGVYVMEG